MLKFKKIAHGIRIWFNAAIAIAVIAVIILTSKGSIADVDAGLFFTPSSSTIVNGSDLTITLTVDPGANAVNGVEAYLTFDETALRLDDVTLLAPFTIAMGETIDNANGTAYIAGAIDFASSGLTADTAVATMTFHALNSATNSQVTIENNSLVTADGETDSVLNTRTPATITITGADTTAPTITSVSSDKAAGTYKTGEIIDIDVNFSEPVTSAGNIVVTLETGATDRTCTFTSLNSATGTCNYTVQAGDTSGDLTVNAITGTIADQASNAMTNFAPTANLAANEAIIIDTTAPTGGSFTINNDAAEVTALTVTLDVICPTDSWGTVQMAFGNSASPTNWTNCAATVSHTLTSGNGQKTVHMRFRDGGQNATSDVTDTITLNMPDADSPIVTNTTPASLSAGTTQQVVSLTTNENADCSYDTVSGTSYYSMANIIATGSGTTSHSFMAAGLVDSGSYGYYVRCRDASGNANTTDLLISFSVASPVIAAPPTVTPVVASSSSKHHSSSKDKKKKTPSRKITNSQKNVKRGAVLTQRGKKFSKNSFVLLYFSKPGGGYYSPQKIKTSSTGAFLVTYRVTKPAGKYGWYAFDVSKNKKSKTVYYTVK